MQSSRMSSEQVNLIRSPKGWRYYWLFMATILANEGNCFVFERVSPVVWTKTNNYVDQGLTRIRVVLKFGNP